MGRIKNFEDFLISKHASGYVGLDDDMVEDFENWIQDLDLDILFKYADSYGVYRSLEGYQEAVKDAKIVIERGMQK